METEKTPKTLEIKVYDEIIISEKEPQNTWATEYEFPVFVSDFVLDELFGGIVCYSRPPTKENNVKVSEKTSSVLSNAFTLVL
jgi:hypothetical protein